MQLYIYSKKNLFCGKIIFGISSFVYYRPRVCDGTCQNYASVIVYLFLQNQDNINAKYYFLPN